MSQFYIHKKFDKNPTTGPQDIVQILTLNAPITNAADNILKYLF